MNKWAVGGLLGVISIGVGVGLAIASQMGERFNTTIIEQIRMGDYPILTFIGMVLMILPPIIILVCLKFSKSS